MPVMKLLQGGPDWRDQAKSYVDRGWAIVPIYRSKKTPLFPAWQTVTLEMSRSSFDEYFPSDKPRNIGCLLGKPSGWLVDVDLDDDNARSLAPRFLPETLTFGRKGNPVSHWLYQCTGIKTAKFAIPETIVEIRSTGCQTVMPGSQHVSGDLINFDNEGDPYEISADELQERVTDLAIATVFSSVWPQEGGRHDAALGLAGILKNAHVSLDRTTRIISAICDVRGDDDAADRLRAVEDTYGKTEGHDVKAWSVFDGSLEGKARRSVKSWLRLKEEPNAECSVHLSINVADETLFTQTVDALVKAGRVYRVGNALVEVIGEQTMPLTSNSVRMRISPPIQFYRHTREGEVSAQPPPWLLKTLIERNAPETVPEIVAIQSTPPVRPDGEITLEPGYDPSTKIYYVPSANTQFRIPNCGLEECIEGILEPFADFPWADPERDLSAWLAALLTITLRGTYSGRAPALLIDKNSAGAGATLLANCLGIIATGRQLPVHLPEGNDEDRKRIGAALLRSDPTIFLDNRREIGGPFLDALLTTEKVDVRILGLSKLTTVDFRSLVIATGNNLVIEGDLARRVFRIRLDSPHVKPHLAGGYRIKDLLGWVGENRAAIVGYLLRLTQLWFQAGCPHHGKSELGGFTSWSRIVRSIVAFSGLGDPMDSVTQDDTAEDPMMNALESLIDALPDSGLQAADMFKMTRKPEGQMSTKEEAIVNSLAILANTNPFQLSAVTIGKTLRTYLLRRTSVGALAMKRTAKSTLWVALRT